MTEAVRTVPIEPRDDINAVRDYLAAVKAKLSKTAAGKNLLARFQTWYDSVDWLDLFWAPNRYVGEAKWYRNEANRLLGLTLPNGWIPADSVAASNSPAPVTDPTPPDSGFPWGRVLLGAGVALGTWLAWRKVLR